MGQLWDAFVREQAGAEQANLLANVRVQSWKTHNRALVAIAETQETFMIVIFGMIGIITVFIVFVVFYMIVSHKSKDIGILKSVGVSDGSVLALFLGFGLLVGIVGSGLGAVAGWQYLANIEQIEHWFSEYLEFRFWHGGDGDMGDIPNQISVTVLVVVLVSVIVGCLFGAVIPSWQAARLKPIEALQVTQL
ncbi:MAG: ABC transporter permease [Planctomycetota bacterium]